MMTDEMNDVRDQLARRLSERMAAEFDARIAESITKRLGEGWTLEEIRGRIHEVKVLGKPGSAIHLDDVPILWVGDVETDVLNPTGILTATRHYRSL